MWFKELFSYIFSRHLTLINVSAVIPDEWLLEMIFAPFLTAVMYRLTIFFREIKNKKYYQDQYRLIFKSCFDKNFQVLSVGIAMLIFLLLLIYDIKGICSSTLGFLIYGLFYVVFEGLCYWHQGYEDADINNCQKDDESIGAVWAHAAYVSYYQVVFNDIREKIASFEKERNVYFSCQKLIIIIPLSCDVYKCLDDKDRNIIPDGFLEREHDQGANINRVYKNQVYKIETEHEPVYFVAEFPSPLVNLWKLKYPKGAMSLEHWKYHRDCFIKTLKKLVSDCPCLLLEYPDEEQPLHQFLLSELDKSQRQFLV